MLNRSPQGSPQRQGRCDRKLIPWADIGMATASNYLVKGILPNTGLAVVWGPPKCGKSFWTFDLSVHVALGWMYRGRPVRQGTVVYCALEGGGGFGNRIEAWRGRNLADDPERSVPFYLINGAFDLIAKRQDMITTIRDELGKAKPAVIVIDTLNRALAGDENKSDDMAKFIRALGEIQAAFDCLVAVVHHCGIVGTRPRGHTSLAGADDAQIRIETKDGIIKATVEHAKDFAAGAVLASKLESVELGIDSDGDAITSCVIVAVEEAQEDEQIDASEQKVSKTTRLALDVLRKLLASSIDSIAAPAECELPSGTRVVRVKRWRELFYLEMGGTQGTKQKAFKRAQVTLADAGIVDMWTDCFWLRSEQAEPGQTGQPDNF